MSARLVALCALLTACAPETLPGPKDFICVRSEGEQWRIEDVQGASVWEGGTYRIRTSDGFYLYRPYAGELCAVIP